MASNRPVLRAQEVIHYRCALCDSKDGVKWFCNNCQECLCDRCKEFHLRGKKTKNDDVVSIRKAQRRGDKPVPEVCKLHPGKLCDLFCSDCDELICSICLSKTHKHHNWKLLEDELSVIKEQYMEHMSTLDDKIKQFQYEASERHLVNKTFNDGIDTTRKEVNSQRAKLKAEVDYIAEAVLAELSALEEEESLRYKKDIHQSEKNIKELTRLLKKAEVTDNSSVSVFEAEVSLRKTLPLYNVKMKQISPKQPRLVTGSIDRVILKNMLGKLQKKHQYEKTDIDSEHVQRLSKFTVPHRNQILSIYPVDDSHVWLSIHQYPGLALVDRKGVVVKTVKLDFCPYRITMVGTTNVLMTTYIECTYLYKISLHNKQVITFADIRPHNAWDVSINKRDEVFVSTGTLDIVVLNQSGTVVRKVTCAIDSCCITCLSSGDIAVSDYDNVYIITDSSGTTKCNWTGRLNNGQKVDGMKLRKMSRDKYDRIFVPDYGNNQVYVLPRDSTKATCLLDQKHGEFRPTAVGVNTCGNVWIGCVDGTVHVMRL